MSNCYYLLLRPRLHWYVQSSGKLLLRHWHWFLIAGLIVPGPPIISLFFFPAGLLEEIVSAANVLSWEFVVIPLFQVAALIWTGLQRGPISGGEFMRYASALPLSKSLRLRVNLTLLMMANALMLVPVAIATVHVLTLSNKWYTFAALWVLLSLTLVAQLAGLERRLLALLGVGLADVLLAWSLNLPAGSLRWLLLILALTSAGIIYGVDLSGNRHTRFLQHLDIVGPMPAVWRFTGRHSPSFLIQAKAVAFRKGLTTFRLSIAVALALAADRLIEIFEFDVRSVPTIILAMAAISLILAGFYRTLRDAHETARPYWTALPLPRRYWPTRDTFFVMGLGVLPLGILLMPLAFHRLSPPRTVLALAVAYLILLALMRLPLVYGRQRVALYGFLLAAVWSGVGIVAVTG